MSRLWNIFRHELNIGAPLEGVRCLRKQAKTDQRDRRSQRAARCACHSRAVDHARLARDDYCASRSSAAFSPLGIRVGTLDRAVSDQQPEPHLFVADRPVFATATCSNTPGSRSKRSPSAFRSARFRASPWVTPSGAAEFSPKFSSRSSSLSTEFPAPPWRRFSSSGLASVFGPKSAWSFLLTFFLNFFNTYTGMRQMDHEYVDLASLMGVKGWKLTFKVIFPGDLALCIYRYPYEHSLRRHWRHRRRICRRHRRRRLFHPHVGGNI